MSRGNRTGPRVRATKGLKRVFSELHDHLYAQSNISRNERLGKELLKIILAKYFDERMGAGIFPEKKGDVTGAAFPRRFREFFEGTLAPRLVNAGVYSRNETVGLDDRSLDFIGQVLAGSALSEDPNDVLGSAFEVFAEGNLAGDQGQFFTPLGIVRMAVGMLDPGPKDMIMDPACGSGGFLNHATRWVMGKKGAKGKERFLKEKVYGIDKDSDLVEIARGISLVTGRSPDNILSLDSLDLLKKDPEGLLEGSDIVLTNPPFGSKIKIKDRSVLSRFELGHRWAYDLKTERWRSTDMVQHREPQILFIEVCMRLLKEGGRCAIVLPDGLFGNPTYGWVRQYVMDNAEVLAVVDCPHDTFMPATHTKTSVLFFKRCARPRKDHGIFMSIVDRCGHDSRGSTLTKEDGEVDEEFSVVAERFRRPGTWGKDRLGFVVEKKALVETILVPRYYDPVLRKEIADLEKSGRYELRTIDELEGMGALSIRNAPATVSKLEYGSGNIPFIRTTDIGNGEVLYPTTHSVSRGMYEEFKDKQGLRPHDILLIKDGTYRVGRSVLLLEEDVECLVQSHFKVIRVDDNDLIDPFLLYHLLQRPIVKKQVDLNTFVQATLSTIGKRFGKVILPIPKDKRRRKRISRDVETRLKERRRLLMELKRMGSGP